MAKWVEVKDRTDGETTLEEARALEVAALAYAGKSQNEICATLNMDKRTAKKYLNSDVAKAFFVNAANEAKTRSSAKHASMLDEAITEAWKHVLAKVAEGHIPTCIKVIEWEARKDAGPTEQQGDTTIQIMMPRQVTAAPIKPDVIVAAEEEE